jgi:deoxyribonuclease IV
MSNSNKKTILGAHLSIQGGFHKAVENAESIGATALQIFTKSNRMWKSKPISKSELELWFQAIKTHSIAPENIIIHASYLINLGSPTKHVASQSTTALIDELHRAETLGIQTLVLHPGSRLDQDLQTSLDQLATNLTTALDRADSSCSIALETMAGQGSTLGSSFEELATILAALPSKIHKRVGVCLDTCHIWAAGYQFDTPDLYKKMWHHFDKTIGLSYLRAIHLNDSKGAFDSHVDRHESIGHGKIPMHAFKYIMNDKKLKAVPKIIETPKNSLDDDKRNIKTLLELID